MQTQHHTSLTPPTHHTSLTQLVKVSVISSYVQSDLSPSHSSWPRPLHTTTPHHLPALSEGPVQSRVSWLLKATVHSTVRQIVNLHLVHKERNEGDKLLLQLVLY